MRLLIVAECEHYRRGAEIVAPGHFRREIDLWARMFDEVDLITQFPGEEAPHGVEPYESTNIQFVIGNGAFSRDPWDRIVSIGRSAMTVTRIIRSIARSDAVHIRCPCRNGMLALLVGRILKRPVYVKWAGEWPVRRDAPWSWRFQEKNIRGLDVPAVVTVYSREKQDPDWIYETETSSLTRAQVEEEIREFGSLPADRGDTLVWVGRLTRNKRVPEMIRGLEPVFGAYPRLKLEVVGDGPDRAAAEHEAQLLGLDERVVFHGWLGWQDLKNLYARARLLLLPSATEGFPKVIHEAALFGTPAVVFQVGALSRIVDGKGGVASTPGDFEAFGRVVGRILADDERWGQLSVSSAEWAAGLSIESVVDRYRSLCEKEWGVGLLPLATTPGIGTG